MHIKLEAKMKLITNIFNAVSNNLISGGAYYLIAKGVLVTAAVTVIAWLVAAILGCGISYLMVYEKKIVSGIGRALCFIFRSVPVILIMWLFYYCIFGASRMNPAIVAGVAIGFWGAGHLSEILANAVIREQEKLSESIRDKLKSVFYSTVVPQALEDSVYDLKRLAVHILQWSAVSGYIAVNDLTEVMYGIGQRTMYPFFSIFFAAILYMIATLIIEWIFAIIDRKIKERNKEQ